MEEGSHNLLECHGGRTEESNRGGGACIGRPVLGEHLLAPPVVVVAFPASLDKLPRRAAGARQHKLLQRGLTKLLMLRRHPQLSVVPYSLVSGLHMEYVDDLTR